MKPYQQGSPAGFHAPENSTTMLIIGKLNNWLMRGALQVIVQQEKRESYLTSLAMSATNPGSVFAEKSGGFFKCDRPGKKDLWVVETAKPHPC
jgi:hypothetical protein